MVFAQPAPDTSGSSPTLAGVTQAIRLLEFDQIQRHLAGHTRTTLGREDALSLTPCWDLLEIARRQQETSEARRFLERGGSLEFGPPGDLRPYVERALLGGVLRGDELRVIQGVLQAARYDRAALSVQQGLPLLAGTAARIPDLTDLEHAISSAISPSGEVVDNASPELHQLRQESRAAHQRLNEAMERSLRRLQRQGAVQEPLVTQRNGRLVLLIKAELKSRVPGIIHDVSDSGATVFIEPMPAIELGNRWRETQLAEEREEERILRQLSSRVGQAGRELLLCLELVARLDLAMAKGRYSIKQRGTAPGVLDAAPTERHLRLTGARHPLLSGAVIPISLELGGEQRVMLVTGPNAGGKTVTLKTVGLLALMAHAGLHVPAEAAHFPLLDAIYTDIGDQQSIEQSLSTFGSHIQNLVSIMAQATANSLVVLDELGTSTDPEEGSALAKAVLSHFRERGLLLVATTHHRGVARYVQEQPGMINASVDLDPQTLEPTYRLTLGLPGRSYALTIASRLGLAPEIIELARSSLSPTEQAAESLLQDLQRERLLVDQLRREMETGLAQARQEQAQVEAQLAAVETTKSELVEQARQELQQRVSELLAELRQAERSLERPQSRSSLREHRVRVDQVRREVASPQWQPIPVQPVLWRQELRAGDRVYIRGIPRPAQVIGPPDGDGEVEVVLGTMRAKVPVYQLERLAEAGQTPNQLSVSLTRAPRAPGDPPAGPGGQTELDLRGLRVEEALAKVEAFLNDATLGGAGAVRIIHGGGTGALRRSIREYLAGHPLVASLGPAGAPSGDGVTVVALK